MNPLRQLWDEHGQAVWLDYIERELITSGGLAGLVEVDGVRGVTSNPSIFHKAITSGEAYQEAVDGLLSESPTMSTPELYEALVIEDIRAAADALRGVYEEAEGADGFVSLEVSPHLARDTAGTVEEARRLWRAVDRPNLMIKVPATAEGLPAVERLIGDGINVNVTLMFSLADYDAVAGAYLRGLEACPKPGQVASVASFFVSRVDSKVDARLEELGDDGARELRGKAAIANACIAYQRFMEVFHGDAFSAYRNRGARVQRPLWASTSTKNPDYPDVLYVEELVGPETVNTIPTSTLDAYRDHGRPRASLREGMAWSAGHLERVAGLGIDLDEITAQLQVEGVAAFADSFDQLIAALDKARLARLTP